MTNDPAPGDAGAGPPDPADAAGGARPRRSPPFPQLVAELRDLVVTYVRQQTVVPLQQLGRYVGFGVLGSVLLGFGVVFLGMAGLRALQTETGDAFTGSWSWVPYLIVFVTLLVGAGLVWAVRSSSRTERRTA